MSNKVRVDRDSGDWKAFEEQLASIRKESEQFGHHGGVAMTPQQFEYAAKHDPNSLGNDGAVEIQWAMKAGKHAETYFSMLQAVADKSKMKLTKYDDQIYREFRAAFPRPAAEGEPEVKNAFAVDKLDMDQMKTEKNKKKWRKLIENYKPLMKEFDLGTIIRMDSSQDYNPDNCEIVPRVQFLAIEIARNREGANNSILPEDPRE
jgi:hypothetical protein